MDRRIAELDGIRALAVIAIVVYHCSFPLLDGSMAVLEPLRSLLWCGVDVFFVLSGFLITRILLDSRQKSGFFRIFYLRRTCRIFPVYYALLATVLVLPWLVDLVAGTHLTQTENYHKLDEGKFWLLTYTHNFIQASGPSQFPGMGHLWSLAVEEQFYLVWPVVVFCCTGRWLYALIVTGVIMQPLLRLLAIQAGFDAWAIMHLTPFRLDGLLLGSLAAVLLEKHSASSLTVQTFSRISLGLGCTLVTATYIVSGSVSWKTVSNQPVLLLAVALVAFGAVLWCCRQDESLPTLRKALKSPHLTIWGKYSYAIYVVHWPVAVAVRELRVKFTGAQPDSNSFLGLLVVSAISFALAWLSWRLLEQPFMKLRPSNPEIPEPLLVPESNYQA